MHEHRLAAIFGRLPDLADNAVIVGLNVRVDALVETVGRLASRLDRIDKRSARSRRKLAVTADLVEASFE
jgi:hypothetical protein